VVTPTADCWLVPAEATPVSAVLCAASALRAAEVSVEYTLSADRLQSRKAGAQLKDAQRAGAACALVFRDAQHVALVSLAEPTGTRADEPVFDTARWAADGVPAALLAALSSASVR